MTREGKETTTTDNESDDRNSPFMKNTRANISWNIIFKGIIIQFFKKTCDGKLK
jgi:hypothetical protein